MDLSWLGNILNGIVGIFSPLKGIKHWLIWSELKNWYSRFKKWRDWYKQHVLAPMKQMQAMQRQIYNQFFKPILTLVDHIRQLTGIIAIFNKKLADKLNFQFLKVESFLLAPFNTATARVNTISRMFGAFLTPLGFFDKPTLLNSIWRDAGLVKEILHNPWGQHPAPATTPPQPTIGERVNGAKQFLSSGTGPYADDVNQGLLTFKTLQAEG